MEEHLGRLLPEGWAQWSNQWLKYEDARREGWAQPDIVWVGPAEAIVYEVKLSFAGEAWPQLDKYGRLVEHLLGVPTYGVQVCKHMTYGVEQGQDFDVLLDGPLYEPKEGRLLWHLAHLPSRQRARRR